MNAEVDGRSAAGQRRIQHPRAAGLAVTVRTAGNEPERGFRDLVVDEQGVDVPYEVADAEVEAGAGVQALRSEEHTSELQSLMRISYAVFCLKKKTYLQYKTSRDNRA